MTYSVGFEDICAIIIIIRFIVLEKRKESQDLVCLYVLLCVCVCVQDTREDFRVFAAI